MTALQTIIHSVHLQSLCTWDCCAFRLISVEWECSILTAGDVVSLWWFKGWFSEVSCSPLVCWCPSSIIASHPLPAVILLTTFQKIDTQDALEWMHQLASSMLQKSTWKILWKGSSPSSSDQGREHRVEQKHFCGKTILKSERESNYNRGKRHSSLPLLWAKQMFRWTMKQLHQALHWFTLIKKLCAS